MLSNEIKTRLEQEMNELFLQSEINPEGEKTGTLLGLNPTCLPEFFIGVWYQKLMEIYANWFERENGKKIAYEDYSPFMEYMKQEIPQLRERIIEKFELIQNFRNE